MENDTQVLDPAVVDPAVIEPAATETLDPVVEEPLDPITGTESSGSSNTSNDNQVAVNSYLDYSTNNLTFYNYTETSESYSTSNESLTNQMSQASGELQLTDDFNCGTANSRLSRSYRFESTKYFKRNKKRARVDRITDFNSEAGDTLELSRRVFKGIGDLDFVSVGSKRGTKRAAKTDVDIIYNQSSGKLYFNANDDNKSFGSKGGLFAVLESSPLVSSSDFILF